MLQILVIALLQKYINLLGGRIPLTIFFVMLLPWPATLSLWMRKLIQQRMCRSETLDNRSWTQMLPSEAFLVVVPTRNRGSSRPMISVLFVLCFCSIQWAITTYTAILTLPFKFESRMNNYIDHKNVSLIRSSWKIESGPQNGRKLRYATQQKKAPQVVEWGIPQWLHLRDWKCFYIRKIEIIVSSYEHDHVLANIGQGSLKSPGFENLRALVQEITVRNSHSSMKKQNKIWSVGGFGICSSFEIFTEGAWTCHRSGGTGENVPQCT